MYTDKNSTRYRMLEFQRKGSSYDTKIRPIALTPEQYVIVLLGEVYCNEAVQVGTYWIVSIIAPKLVSMGHSQSHITSTGDTALSARYNGMLMLYQMTLKCASV